jgi:ABC-type uncharacterized transport system permease subunit
MTTVRPSIFTSSRFWSGVFIVVLGLLGLVETFLTVNTREEEMSEIFFGGLTIVVGLSVAFKWFMPLMIMVLGAC